MTRIDSIYVLHPAMRDHLAALRADLLAEKIPLQPFETMRSALRQHELFSQGRTKPGPGASAANPLGRMCTKADAWWSFHQYGLAVDMVFCATPGAWSWNEPEKGMWDRYTELARIHGLRTLSFERPHCELPVAIDALRRGEYPAGGDRDWEDALTGFIAEWGDRPGAPPVPHGRPGIG